ncbi:efflux RND transporter periplasmic adaptor subunit [Dyadobacter sandarakinus]|uniref:Efflux RND transporter periplasmic adaptor subunit n=1 Tax=Dyadobacter sandarakinus TaxID=2747268 RepID=A0ABX7I2H3_9BACT|nr:efflux RND transporter periplasmic adaptor subunit [Dyadobacter sandarakinus]QRR00083.1 efflux RND transporter periplasmic adaptor subunit [Dyadobacter sandarakinus]
MEKSLFHSRQGITVFLLLSALAAGIYSCGPSTANTTATGQPPAQSLPVLTVTDQQVTAYREFTASVEGSRDIEIRPQVDGYLDRISVDEGAYVRKGQVLFHIDPRPYQERLNTAKATLASAQAALESAQINVDKLTPLVANNVVSDVQLKSAKASYNAAVANVSSAQAAVDAAKIDIGYTAIKAPADGYIGTIPFKTGSLVGKGTMEALTILSETKDIHVYFSMSELDFLDFKKQFAGNTIEQKIREIPSVELVLADNSVYPQKGKVEIVDGQFDKTMGAIKLRATFPNANGLLRSGNTGRIRIPRELAKSVLIPQEATFEVQDKVFVYALLDSNKVEGRPVTISDRSGRYYLISNGLKPGEKIVYNGLDRLRDGMAINPQKMSMDSLLSANPI